MTRIGTGSQISRRGVLKRAAALAGTAAMVLSVLAHGQSKGTMVDGTWAWDCDRLLTKNIEEPFLISEGWEVIQDQAGDPQRRSKMLAERRLPRGTSDVQGLSALNIYQMGALGVTDEIDYDRVPNAVNLLPGMGYTHGIGSIYSGGGLALGAGLRVPIGDTSALTAQTAWSVRNYKLAEARFVAPRLAGGAVQVETLAQWIDAPRVALYGVGPDTTRDARTEFELRPATVGATAAWRAGRLFTAGGGADYLHVSSTIAETASFVIARGFAQRLAPEAVFPLGTLAVNVAVALRLCRLTGTQPSLLLHPTDFLGCDDTHALSFFPAMRLPSASKVEFVSDVLHKLCAQFTVVTLRQHAQHAAAFSRLPMVEPSFRGMAPASPAYF